MTSTRSIGTTILLLATSVMIYGCSSPKGGVGNQYLKRLGVHTYDFDYDLNELSPEIVVNRHTPEDVYLGIVATAGDAGSARMKTINRIGSVSFVVLDDDGGVVDSLYTEEITMSGISSGRGSTVASAGVEWTPEVIPTDLFTLVTIVRTTDDAFWLRQAATTLPKMLDYDPITVSLEVEPKEPGLFFIASAKRHIAAGETEYLPSSEQMRITIYDGPVKIWSSADGAVFTQAISKIQPTDVGEEMTWEFVWDGTGSDGKRVAGGLYTIEAMIPSRPTPYYVRKDFRWSGM